MSSPQPPVPIDTELSNAVLAYLDGSTPLGKRTEALAAHAVRRSAEELRAEIDALIGEMNGVPVTARGITVWEECELVAAVFVPRHPELSTEALNALMMRYAWANR